MSLGTEATARRRAYHAMLRARAVSVQCMRELVRSGPIGGAQHRAASTAFGIKLLDAAPACQHRGSREAASSPSVGSQRRALGAPGVPFVSARRLNSEGVAEKEGGGREELVSDPLRPASAVSLYTAVSWSCGGP